MKLIPTIGLIILALVPGVESKGQTREYTIQLIDQITNKGIWNVEIKLDDRTVTKSNYHGFLKLKTIPGDMITLKHEKYEDKYVILPEENKFKVPMNMEIADLDYEGGLKSLYQYIVGHINDPLENSPIKMSQYVFVEIEVKESGKSDITSIVNDHEGIIREVLTEVFKFEPGAWDSKYSGKTFLLPIQLDWDTPDETNYDELQIPDVDKVLGKIIVTPYGSFYNENLFVENKANNK